MAGNLPPILLHQGLQIQKRAERLRETRSWQDILASIMAQALFLVERDVKLDYPLGAVFSVGERPERWKCE